MTAGLGTAVRNELYHSTVFHTCIFIVKRSLFTGSGAFNESCHSCAFSCFYTHDLCYDFPNFFTAYRTGIDWCFAFCDSSRQTGTAWITTATAVIARKRCQHLLLFLIYIYLEPDACRTQKQSQEQTESCHNNNCCDNR